MIFKSFLNRLKFNKICKNIKSIKIQGARNVAKAALDAYYLFPSKETKHKLLSLRPTEPMMARVLSEAETTSKDKILNHFDSAQEKINSFVNGIVKNKDIIFTHCHSTNVVNSLIYSKHKGKRFQVYNTETRPLFQGRKTAKELSSAGIKVTQFVDSAIQIALTKEQDKEQNTSPVTKVFLGADALTKDGIVNKVGSGIIARIAFEEKIPVYIIADSWKFTNKFVPLEQRGLNELWDNAPKNVRIKNPAFEFVNKKHISGVITELGLMKYSEFLKTVGKIKI